MVAISDDFEVRVQVLSIEQIAVGRFTLELAGFPQIERVVRVSYLTDAIHTLHHLAVVEVQPEWPLENVNIP